NQLSAGGTDLAIGSLVYLTGRQDRHGKESPADDGLARADGQLTIGGAQARSDLARPRYVKFFFVPTSITMSLDRAPATSKRLRHSLARRSVNPLTLAAKLHLRPSPHHDNSL